MVWPIDDDATEDEPEGGVEDEQPAGWIGIAIPRFPIGHGHMSQLRVGSMHLGSVFSSGSHHVAISHDGDVSEHGSHDAAIKHLNHQHGIEQGDRRYGNEANAY